MEQRSTQRLIREAMEAVNKLYARGRVEVLSDTGAVVSFVGADCLHDDREMPRALAICVDLTVHLPVELPHVPAISRAHFLKLTGRHLKLKVDPGK